MTTHEVAGHRYLSGIETIADARTRILSLLEETAELNKDIEYYVALAAQPGADSQACWQARTRAITDRNYNRDAIKYLEYWCRAETQRLREQREYVAMRRGEAYTQEPKVTKKAGLIDATPEERAVQLEYKKATIAATKQKVEVRALAIERQQRAIALLDEAKTSGTIVLLEQAYDLLLSLVSSQRAVLTGDEEAVIDTLRPLLTSYREEVSQ